MEEITPIDLTDLAQLRHRDFKSADETVDSAPAFGRNSLKA
jgi:hypothetical protein